MSPRHVPQRAATFNQFTVQVRVWTQRGTSFRSCILSGAVWARAVQRLFGDKGARSTYCCWDASGTGRSWESKLQAVCRCSNTHPMHTRVLLLFWADLVHNEVGQISAAVMEWIHLRRANATAPFGAIINSHLTSNATFFSYFLAFSSFKKKCR